MGRDRRMWWWEHLVCGCVGFHGHDPGERAPYSKRASPTLVEISPSSMIVELVAGGVALIAMRRNIRMDPLPEVIEEGADGQGKGDERSTRTGVEVEEEKSAAARTASSKMMLLRGSWWLNRALCVRYIAFIYVVAFAVAADQYKPLMGERGLTPAKRYMDHLSNNLQGSPLQKAMQVPSIFFWIEPTDNNVLLVCYIGAAAALLLATGVICWAPAMLLCWTLYHSLNSMGQTWYSFGWESQLLETSLVAAFMCPFLSLSAFDPLSPPPYVPRWAWRWLLFRIMLGAGLIKIRGDECWRDLTCMLYHYETQPVPNPISWYLHNMPRQVQLASTLANHIVELVCPVLLLIPWRPAMLVGGSVQLLFQTILIISGNLSFLNWLTIAPALACFDDASIAKLFSKRTRSLALSLQAQQQQQPRADQNNNFFWRLLAFWKMDGDQRKGMWAVSSRSVRSLVQCGFGIMIAILSAPVVSNLMSQRQAMNRSFDPFKIVNTYGAFGSVGKVRDEIVIQGTRQRSPVDGRGVEWQDYEFKCKPGAVARRPCLISPYHYRLDWLAWFAGFQTYQHQPWTLHLIDRMLEGDVPLLKQLLAHNPFPDPSKPPTQVRVMSYRYRYTTYAEAGPFGPLFSGKDWWVREAKGPYLPTELERSNPSVKKFLAAHGWIDPVGSV